jgi:hypothetical protein
MFGSKARGGVLMKAQIIFMASLAALFAGACKKWLGMSDGGGGGF